MAVLYHPPLTTRPCAARAVTKVVGGVVRAAKGAGVPNALRQPAWWPAIALFAVLVAGLALLAADPGPPAASASILAPTAHRIQVTVTGAVHAPGAYVLPASATVGDALTAAGGSLPRARDDIALGVPLWDGAAVFVADGDGGLPSQPQPIAARIDLNRASRAELEALPGIGEARAEAVIEARAVQPLASLEDLVQRGVWPSSVAERVRPYVGVAP